MLVSIDLSLLEKPNLARVSQVANHLASQLYRFLWVFRCSGTHPGHTICEVRTSLSAHPQQFSD